MSLKRFLSTFPAVAVAVLAFALTFQPAFAQEEEDEGPSLFARALGAVGLLAIPGPGIDYTERAPLVVPPTMTNIAPTTAPSGPQGIALPVDQNGNPIFPDAPQPQANINLPAPVDPSAIRQRHPDFPVDPEVRAAQKAKAKKKKTGPYIMSDDPMYGRRLRPDEMRGPGQVRQSSGTVDPNGNQTFGPGGQRSTVQELGVPFVGNLFGKKDDQPVQFEGEPPRQSLTQPPSGYLTPSANAPYGVVGKEKYVPERSGPSNSPQTAPR